MENDERKTKQTLGKLIDFFARSYPEPSKAAEDLWKYAKIHDKRTYSLIRFCMAPESDYRKVFKSIVSPLNRCLYTFVSNSGSLIHREKSNGA